MGVYAAAMFVTVGLAFTALGAYQLAEPRRFARGAARAPGVVVELQARRPARPARRRRHHFPNILFFPVVRFRPPVGREVTFLSRTGTNPPQFEVGAEVSVVYDPRNPSIARVESVLTNTAFPLFIAFMGLLFAGFGAALLVTFS